jgi:hypothetical protein
MKGTGWLFIKAKTDLNVLVSDGLQGIERIYHANIQMVVIPERTILNPVLFMNTTTSENLLLSPNISIVMYKWVVCYYHSAFILNPNTPK